jgi:hypothetical protein
MASQSQGVGVEIRLLGVGLASMVVLCAPAITLGGEWGWHHPQPQGTVINGFWGTGPNDVLAVGAAGSMIRFDGTRWLPMTAGVSTQWWHAWGTGFDNLYVVGDSGTIMHFDGATWSSMASPTPYNIFRLWGSGPTDIFAVAGEQGPDYGWGGGAVLHYDGAAWTIMQGAPTHHMCGISGNGPNDVYAFGCGGFYHYNGTSWSSMAPPPATVGCTGMWCAGPNAVYATGYDIHDAQSFSLRVFRYDGSTWSGVFTSMIPVLSLASFWSAGGSGPNDVYFGGSVDYLVHYDGTAWSTLSVWEGASELRALSAPPVGNVFVGGRAPFGGLILSSWDGHLWKDHRKTVVDARVDILDFWGVSPNFVFAVGTMSAYDQYGYLLYYDGTQWKLTYTVYQWRTFRAVWGSQLNDIFFVGGRTSSSPSPTIVHFNGATMADMTPNTVVALFDVWGSGPNDVYAVGGSSGLGAVIHYDGTAWSQVRTESASINGVWGTAANNVMAVGDGGRILRYDGSAWSTMTSPTTRSLRSLWGTGASGVFAVGDGGTILTFNGSTWSPMTSGTDALLRAVRGSGPNDVYAVGDSGVILRYDGTSWGSMRSGTGVSLRAVWPLAPQDVLVSGTSSTILHYPRPSALWTHVVNSTWGQIEISPNQVTYAPNAVVTLTAVPIEGKRFGGWSGNVPAGHEMDNPLSLVMDADKSITASFKCGSGVEGTLPLAVFGVLVAAAIRRRRR